MQAQAAYDTANQHLASMKQVSRQAALKAARGELESAAEISGAEAELGYSEIRGPIARVVTDRPLYDGETAASGTPLITVMDISALLAKIHLAQAEAQLLKTGDAVSVEVPGFLIPSKAKSRWSARRSIREARRWKSGFASQTPGATSPGTTFT